MGANRRMTQSWQQLGESLAHWNCRSEERNLRGVLGARIPMFPPTTTDAGHQMICGRIKSAFPIPMLPQSLTRMLGLSLM